MTSPILMNMATGVIVTTERCFLCGKKSPESDLRGIKPGPNPVMVHKRCDMLYRDFLKDRSALELPDLWQPEIINGPK